MVLYHCRIYFAKGTCLNCLLLLHVAPPLMLIMTSFLVMPTNRLAILSPSLRIHQCTKCDTRNLCKQNVTIVFLPICHLAQPSICGNSWYLSPKGWKWQICHTHKAFKVPVLTFSNNLWTFPPGEINSNWISCHSNSTVFSSTPLVNSTWFTSREKAAMRP